MFGVAAGGSLPGELAGVADRVTVQFPWGSLLTGILRGEGQVLENLAMVAAPGAVLTILLSVVDRDRASLALVPARPAQEPFAVAAFEICDLRPAVAAEVAATGSTWAKRLGAGVDRPVTLLRAVRR